MSDPAGATPNRYSRYLVVAVPYIWLLVFFLAPFLIIFKISLSTTAIAMPPYTPAFDGLTNFWDNVSELTFDNYIWLTENSLYLRAYLSSIKIALISTVLLLMVGYPMPTAWPRRRCRSGRC
ncbi:Putrescine transport system permease protein PotH [Methylobrevis pamukkalensis]|uniref:Putrescine transport system permease protein PotH n=1 Tax=Methylobrevis pamukkalensis TaxID=1439726 RepID=A0A1E3H003_9HYPH|nr:Putrescine transport system permease protein PotH [Methylobrevis pamukkalensis]